MPLTGMDTSDTHLHTFASRPIKGVADLVEWMTNMDDAVRMIAVERVVFCRWGSMR